MLAALLGLFGAPLAPFATSLVANYSFSRPFQRRFNCFRRVESVACCTQKKWNRYRDFERWTSNEPNKEKLFAATFAVWIRSGDVLNPEDRSIVPLASVVGSFRSGAFSVADVSMSSANISRASSALTSSGMFGRFARSDAFSCDVTKTGAVGERNMSGNKPFSWLSWWPQFAF